MHSLPELKAALGGVIVGRQVVCPGPGHSRKDRSLAVRPTDTNPLGFIVTSYCGDDWRECRDHVAEALGLDLDGWRTGPVHDDPMARMARKAAIRRAEEEEAAELARRIERARALWVEAVDPRGTVVERYLTRRALDLPEEIAGQVLRLHPSCPFGPGRRVLAMVAAVRSVITGELVAVHRTELTADGQKVGRKMLGPVADAAIMLDWAGADLAVGEGIESALSARQLGCRPVWALGSAGAMGRLPVIPNVSTLLLLEERDDASARAVLACGDRWKAANRQVTLIRPPAGCSDLNDAIRRNAR